jgi:hypothetical protein
MLPKTRNGSKGKGICILAPPILFMPSGAYIIKHYISNVSHEKTSFTNDAPREYLFHVIEKKMIIYLPIMVLQSPNW